VITSSSSSGSASSANARHLPRRRTRSLANSGQQARGALTPDEVDRLRVIFMLFIFICSGPRSSRLAAP
jgi:hypothetical protein